ncbi:hypothetical protein [Pseudomonas sp. 18173]|uniref:hypothetical protein n=1 Tax=Pseudomonas sp. 18173 TaxID=3390055 RepID=UPI003D1E7D93
MTNDSDNENSSAYDLLFALFSTTPLGALYQLSPHLLSKENQAILEDMVGKAKVEFIAYLDRIAEERILNEQIENWRSQEADPKYTRAIVKIINNTPHAFKIVQTSLPLTPSDFETFEVVEEGTVAFRSEFAYRYAFPWGKNKVMFNHFIDFADQDICARLDLGMFMNTSFGVFSPTVKSTIKNTIKSIGKSRINCSTKITSRSDEAPFNFEVCVTLG